MKVLLDGKVIEMTDEEMRKRGVLGGPDWDRRQEEYAVKRSHEEVLRGMDLDGTAFHRKMGRGPVLAGKDRGDETSFEEIFEDQDSW